MSNSAIDPKVRTRSPISLDECGTALAANIIGDRWTLLIIREAFYGVRRYDDIREDIGIPRSVLTQRLKRLVDLGIFDRFPYREEGARTRYGYVLTKAGQQLGLTLLALMQWGDEFQRDGMSAMKILDKNTGKILKVALVEDQMDTVPLNQISLKPIIR